MAVENGDRIMQGMKRKAGRENETGSGQDKFIKFIFFS